LVEEGGSNVARRFLDDVAHTFTRLHRFPNLGRPWPTRNPAIAGLRRLPLQHFPLSVFYRPTRTAIEIIRVLHHARDLPPLLDDI
jgi:plasmid stabilization system protein ParE